MEKGKREPVVAQKKAPEQIVQEIALSSEAQQKRQAFVHLQSWLEHPALLKNKKIIIPLLYDSDASIRQESAFWCERLGLKLKSEDYAQYLFALQDFAALIVLGASDEAARRLLFTGFTDKNLRLRTRLLKYIHEKDCRTMQEKILYFYGRGDYESLTAVYFNCSATDRAFLLALLHEGVRAANNMPYHRRQCALLLEKLSGAEELEESIKELLKTPAKAGGKAPLQINTQPIKALSALDMLVDKLQRRGLWLEGRLIFPRLSIGPATGRVTYRDPGLQTWPKEKRLAALQPPRQALLIFDYQSIEPLILLNILLNEHLLSIADIPDGDVYEAIHPQDRAAGKRFVNSLINGGRRRPDFNPGPFYWKLLPALDELRAELWMRFNRSGVVETIAGRLLPVDKKEANLNGKIMNRLIQGSAADFFNQAVVELDARLEEGGGTGQVYFLLFDEVWLCAEKERAAAVSAQAEVILNEQYKRYNFTLPVKVRRKKVSKGEEEKRTTDG